VARATPGGGDALAERSTRIPPLIQANTVTHQGGGNPVLAGETSTDERDRSRRLPSERTVMKDSWSSEGKPD